MKLLHKVHLTALCLMSSYTISIFANEGSTMLQTINPPREAIPGISQGVLVETNKLLFLSGHVPVNSDGLLVGTSLEAQMDQVMKNLNATLHAADTNFSNVVRLTIYIRDYKPSLLPTIRSVRDRWINLRKPPASALIGVAELYQPDVLIEIDAIAVVP